MALCNITGTIYLPSGELARSARVIFSRADKSVRAEYLGAVIPDDTITQTNSAGEIDVSLLTGRYVLFTGKYSGGAVVPDADTADISDILTIVTPDIPVPAWLAQALAARDAAVAAADRAEAAADEAVAAGDAAVAAGDAAFVNADVYPDIATGRAAVADGEQFQVLTGAEYVRYRRDSSTTQTEVGRYPTSAAVNGKADITLATPSYPSRAAAETGTPGLPTSVTQILVREGTALVVRSRTAFSDDPLFPSGARWGVVQRQDSATLLSRIALPLGAVGGTGDAVTAEIPAALVLLGQGDVADGQEVIYTPTATNAAANPTVRVNRPAAGTIAAATGTLRGVRGADGQTWPANGFVTGRSYTLRRVGSAYRVVQGDVTVAEIAATLNSARNGVRQTLVYLDVATGTANEIVLASPPNVDWYSPVGGNLFAFRAATDNTGPVTFTIEGITRSLRRSDNSVLQAGDLLTGHVYQVLITGTSSGRLFGEITREEITRIYDLIADETEGVLSSEYPESTDAGLVVVDEAGGVLMDVREGMRIAGRDETVQESLRKVEWRGVRSEALPLAVNAVAIYDFTDESAKYVQAGAALRGGNGAPIPAWQLPIKTEIGKNWLASATVRLLRDHPRISADPFFLANKTEESFVHPYVSYFPLRFMGYEYLMVVNPYPQSNPLLENPVLYGSHDMQNWDLLTHIPQPMAWGEDYDPSASNTYLSDPSMAYNPTSRELIVTWRRHMRNGVLDSDGDTHRIEAVTTMDGLQWSSPVKIMGSNTNLGETSIVSPTYVFNPASGLWYCYACRDPEWQVMTKRDLFDPDEEWSTPVNIGINGWHGEARVIGGRVWFFPQSTTQWHTRIYWSDPNDWTVFTRIDSGTGIIDASDWATGVGGGKAWTYKNSFVPHIYPDGTISLKIIFQCKRPANEWWLFKLETPRLPYTDSE